MANVLHLLWHGLRDSLLMGWEVWWAIALGFAVSAVVQAWVPRERIEHSLGGGGARPLALATGLGAASSSCSYAAIAIGRSLFQKGAAARSMLAFQFASTNLVWELAGVLWVLLGWQFTLAEFIGGLVMIALMAVLLRVFVSPRVEQRARQHAETAASGHQHHMASSTLPLRSRLTSISAWSDVAHNYRGDWQMLYREIGLGLVISGFVAQLNNHAFHALFLGGAPTGVRTVWGALIGPVISMLTFVCSVANIPLAAVLWSGGISFAGALSFIFADLVILPIIAIYRKFYGTAFALKIVALMLVTMVLAALAIQGLFHVTGLIPQGPRPGRSSLFTGVRLNYTLVLNALGLSVFLSLFGLTARRGVTDPVCGMKVDRGKALTSELGGKTYYFCSAGCKATFDADPDRHLRSEQPATPADNKPQSSHGHEITL